MKKNVFGWPLTNFIIFEATAVPNQVCTQAQQRRRQEARGWRHRDAIGSPSWRFYDVMWCAQAQGRSTSMACTYTHPRPWPYRHQETLTSSAGILAPPGRASKINCLLKLFNWSEQIKWWAQLLKYLKSCGVMMRFGSEIDFNPCFSKRCFFALVQKKVRLQTKI